MVQVAGSLFHLGQLAKASLVHGLLDVMLGATGLVETGRDDLVSERVWPGMVVMSPRMLPLTICGPDQRYQSVRVDFCTFQMVVRNSMVR